MQSTSYALLLFCGTMAQELLRFLCLLVAATGFVTADPPENLVDLTKPPAREFPYTVSIKFASNHYCGGSIIGPRHILTAGHCILFAKDIPAVLMTVVSGTDNHNKGGEVHQVAEAIMHPEYNLTGTGVSWDKDLGILKLKKPINFNAYQRAIGLPTGTVKPGTVALLSGWGKSMRKLDSADILQQMYVVTIKNVDCAAALRREIPKSAFCTMTVDGGTDICTRGSGSPLTDGSSVIGVVSASIPCARGYPDIFANVYENMDFIANAMAL